MIRGAHAPLMRSAAFWLLAVAITIDRNKIAIIK
jgi:hypothetical protein